MDRLKVIGGVRLAGRVRTDGAKNAALPALCASLLTAGELKIDNVPDVRDVRTLLRLLESTGVESQRSGSGVTLRTAAITNPEAPYDLVRTMRASVLVLGPLVARAGRARVSLPGGCAIGVRPIDFHIEALRRLGAEVTVEHGYVEAAAERLRGADFSFPQKSVTGTENLLMAATLAEGTTVLRNCAEEPEVTDLARLLVAMGARIRGAGTATIEIDGVEELHGADHRVIPDRIEAGTFLIAGAVTGGEVVVDECVPGHLEALLDHLESAGQEIEQGESSVQIRGVRPAAPVDCTTGPYPGFPTDLQAQFMVLMTQASGLSVIRETIFENRFQHAAELRRMGARIDLEGRKAVVQGEASLSGADLMATDLRASASLVLAALVADGESIINRIYHLDRGYAHIEEKLHALGATVERLV